VKKLAGYEFEWVLPGHGERAHFDVGEMRREMEKLIGAVTS
jgi:hypothetical protein